MQGFTPLGGKSTAAATTLAPIPGLDATNVQDAIAALSPPERPDFVIDEMSRGSREPYSRFPLLPVGVAEVSEGDIVVNAMPVIKSTSYPDMSTLVPTGLVFNFKDGVGRKATNPMLPITFTFTTTGPDASLADQAAQINAALAADDIPLVVIASPDTFEALAVYGTWSGTNEDPLFGYEIAEISGSFGDVMGLTGKLLPRRLGYADPVTYNQIRFNGSYRSWSKVNILVDGGGLARNGERWLPGADYPWITFGVVIERPGVPGEFDVVVRNATIIGSETSPNALSILADPMREYIDPRGLVFVSAT